MKQTFQSRTWLVLLMGLFFLTACQLEEPRPKRVLVFSKTEGFRHKSIEKGIDAIQKLGAENGFEVVATEEADQMTEEVLKTFSVVVFLNTTQDILDHYQQADFERFIQAGGGFVGVHAAADTEYHWPWYNGLVGAYFDSHPEIQEAMILRSDQEHTSTAHLPETWERTDEWYNYKSVNPDLNILLWLDENSYEGGNMGEKHPLAWYHEYDGGRAFYTGCGHTAESYDEPEFLQHLLAGIEYAIGENRLDYALATSHRVPEENRFVRTVLARNLYEPMELDILPDGRILFIERRGGFKMFDPERETVELLATVPVHTNHEDGLIGLAIDPNYEENNWIYLCYSPPGDEPKQNVSRFVFKDDSLHFATEKIVLEIEVQREECCHAAGSLEFDHEGNLWISVGDNTNPFASDGYAPIDERPGRKAWDAQGSAANTNDLRGKILRIHPEDDGTYSIPEGNLFPIGTPNTRPEIYVMGCRNPFRYSIDSKRGYLYWGDVGPDAGKDGELRGPKGIDEVNVAKHPGFWGWPYSRGNNQAYYDYNFTTKESGPRFNTENPVNNSPNNTGITELPPIQKSMIWYSYDDSEEFPWVKKGGKNPMAGPVFYADEFETDNKFPPYFEGKLLIYEWMRNWMYVVKMDSTGSFLRADPFMPNTVFSRPMDMLYGKDGSLYVLEYGLLWYAQNLDARLIKIDYIKGNRKPVAQIAAKKSIGAAPLTSQFSAEPSIDYDGDKLSYQWYVNDEKQEATSLNFNYTFEYPGVYEVKLKVTDPDGKSATVTQEVQVGNEPPVVAWTMEGNQSFYWNNRNIAYQVSVEDVEDGKSSDPEFNRENVLVTFDYLSEGLDETEIAQGHSANMAQSRLARGARLIDESDCKGCHAINKKINGPSYLEVARHYKGDETAESQIVSQIINGGSGKWGESVMSAHPDISNAQAKDMAAYILSLADEKTKQKGAPLEGVFVANKHQSAKEEGSYILIATYTDTGNGDLEPLMSQEKIVLVHPKLQIENSDVRSQGPDVSKVDDATVVTGLQHGDYFGFQNIDLTDIEALEIQFQLWNSAIGGTVEARIGSESGELLGEATIKVQEGFQNVSIPIADQKGKTNIFFVFRNENAEAGETICNADWVYFKPKQTGSLSSIN